MAEWCQTDPVERYYDNGGRKWVIHVFITAPDTPENKAALHRWKRDHTTNVVIANGAMQIAGPACEYRVWAEAKAGKEKMELGSPGTVHHAGDPASISLATLD